MAGFLTLTKLLSMFKLLNLSSLPSSNPGSGRPWLHGSGSVVVGAFSPTVVTWESLSGKPSEFPPAAHTQLASTISDFNEAVDDELNNCLVPGTDVTLNYNDAANTLTIGLSNNVPRLNAASNAFTPNASFPNSSVRVEPNPVGLGTTAASGIGFYNPSGQRRGGIAVNNSNALQIESSQGNAGALIRIASNSKAVSILGFDGTDGDLFCGTITIGTGVSIVRNATGPAFETRAAGGARICNADGSALAALACGAINASATLTGHRLGHFGHQDSITVGWPGSSFGGYQCGSSGIVSWLSMGLAFGANANGVAEINSGNLVAFGGSLRDLTLRNLTASGNVQGTFRPTQFTVATLPSAAANTGRTVQVTDSSVDFPGNIGATVAGGGANNVDVKSNGTNWRITG